MMLKILYRSCLSLYVKGGLSHIGSLLFLAGHRVIYEGVTPSLPDEVWEDAQHEYWTREADNVDSDTGRWWHSIFEGDDAQEEPYYNECNMCGGEWVLNDQGYCSRCWQVWNS